MLYEVLEISTAFSDARIHLIPFTDASREELLQLRFKCTAQYFVSVLVMCVSCLSTRSPSKSLKNIRPVATDPEIEGARTFEK
jgi:hypothetical protein